MWCMSVLLYSRHARFIALKTIFSFAGHALLSIASLGMAPAAWALAVSGTEQGLAPVLVSASRFPDVFDRIGAAPVGAIVIDAEQIRQSGADNVNQAIRNIAGIAGRQNNYGTSDFTLDLRGFGASADQNVVVLLDGVRLSENEMSTALLSAIPIETVQRIEIVRGGGSVLYGEGATGGIIQVMTKRPTRRDADAGSQMRGSIKASIALSPQAVWFAKTGRSYRVANVDENGFTLQPGQMLLPQLSNDLALGARFGGARHGLTATFFQHRLRDEIIYDPTIANPVTGGNGANVNLSPTLRRGLELEARSQLNAALAFSMNFQHVAARFRSGPNAGKEMVLVPRNTAGARLHWHAGRHTAWVGMLWAARQRYGSDFDNSCASRMPAYVTLDARYALRLAHWELAASGSNLGNKNYFSQAYSCAGGIYPAAGR